MSSNSRIPSPVYHEKNRPGDSHLEKRGEKSYGNLNRY